VEIEYVNGKHLTYGEAHFLEQSSIQMINGEFVNTIFVQNKQRAMPHEEAKSKSHSTTDVQLT